MMLFVLIFVIIFNIRKKKHSTFLLTFFCPVIKYVTVRQIIILFMDDLFIDEARTSCSDYYTYFQNIKKKKHKNQPLQLIKIKNRSL
jgi:hypothetical protein